MSDTAVDIEPTIPTEEATGDTPPNRESDGGGLFSFANPSGKGWKKGETDTPPKEPKPRGRPVGSSNRVPKAKIKKTVASFYLGTGMLTMKYVNEYDGQVVIHNAESLTEQTMKLAEEYPWVMSTLESWTSVSALGGFIGVLCAVGIPIMVNHGMAPPIALEFVDAPPLESEHEAERETED